MNNLFAPPPSSNVWAHEKMGPQRFRRQRFLDWWYGIAAPREAGAQATDKQRNAVQRGRTASLILLCLIPIMVGVGYIGFKGPNTQILWTAIGELVVIGMCLLMNRWGQWKGVYWGVNATGIALALATSAGMYLSILRAPGGLSVNDKDIFYLLMFSEVMIGAILPPRWIFAALTVNLAFSCYMLSSGSHTPALQAVLATSLVTILIRVFQVHLIPSVIVWALAITTRESLDRANYATKVAQLQHDMAQRELQEAEQAEALKRQIENMSAILMKATRGDRSTRIPTMEGDTLWQLAAPINVLLSHVQRGYEAEKQLQALSPDLERWHMQDHHWQRLLKEVASTLQVVQAAHQSGKPVRLVAGKTPLDDLQQALDGKMLMLPPRTVHFVHASENKE